MRTALLLLVVAAAACGDSDASKSGQAAASTPADPVLAAWKKAGLSVGAFSAVDGAAYGGGDCYAGQVNNIDAVVCQYASPELAVAAEPKGREAVAGFTGAAISNGRLLLVVSDPRKADPEGRAINLVTLAFEGRKPKEAR
jgi:hypothetical protein